MIGVTGMLRKNCSSTYSTAGAVGSASLISVAGVGSESDGRLGGGGSKKLFFSKKNNVNQQDSTNDDLSRL